MKNCPLSSGSERRLIAQHAASPASPEERFAQLQSRHEAVKERTDPALHDLIDRHAEVHRKLKELDDPETGMIAQMFRRLESMQESAGTDARKEEIARITAAFRLEFKGFGERAVALTKQRKSMQELSFHALTDDPVAFASVTAARFEALHAYVSQWEEIVYEVDTLISRTAAAVTNPVTPPSPTPTPTPTPTPATPPPATGSRSPSVSPAPAGPAASPPSARSITTPPAHPTEDAPQTQTSLLEGLPPAARAARAEHFRQLREVKQQAIAILQERGGRGGSASNWQGKLEKFQTLASQLPLVQEVQGAMDDSPASREKVSFAVESMILWFFSDMMQFAGTDLRNAVGFAGDVRTLVREMQNEQDLMRGIDRLAARYRNTAIEPLMEHVQGAVRERLGELAPSASAPHSSTSPKLPADAARDESPSRGTPTVAPASPESLQSSDEEIQKLFAHARICLANIKRSLRGNESVGVIRAGTNSTIERELSKLNDLGNDFDRSNGQSGKLTLALFQYNLMVGEGTFESNDKSKKYLIRFNEDRKEFELIIRAVSARDAPAAPSTSKPAESSPASSAAPAAKSSPLDVLEKFNEVDAKQYADAVSWYLSALHGEQHTYTAEQLKLSRDTAPRPTNDRFHNAFASRWRIGNVEIKQILEKEIYVDVNYAELDQMRRELEHMPYKKPLKPTGTRRPLTDADSRLLRRIEELYDIKIPYQTVLYVQSFKDDHGHTHSGMAIIRNNKVQFLFDVAPEEQRRGIAPTVPAAPASAVQTAAPSVAPASDSIISDDKLETQVVSPSEVGTTTDVQRAWNTVQELYRTAEGVKNPATVAKEFLKWSKNEQKGYIADAKSTYDFFLQALEDFYQRNDFQKMETIQKGLVKYFKIGDAEVNAVEFGRMELLRNDIAARKEKVEAIEQWVPMKAQFDTYSPEKPYSKDGQSVNFEKMPIGNNGWFINKNGNRSGRVSLMIDKKLPILFETLGAKSESFYYPDVDSMLMRLVAADWPEIGGE